MSYLSRSYDFTPSTLIQSSQVDAEFNQLVNILNGSKTDTQVKIVHNTSSEAFAVDNTGGGVIASFKVGGVEKAKINASGQFESTLTTGTAPLVVASTTKVDNLNADTVDGYGGSDLAKLSGSNTFTGTNPIQTFQGTESSGLILEDTGETWSKLRVLNDGGVVAIARFDDPTWEVFVRFNLTTKKLQISDDNGSNWSNVASVDDDTFWTWGVFYAGAIDTSIKQSQWIVPASIDSVQAKHIRLIYQSATPTGTSTFTIRHKNSSGVEQNNKSVSLTSGATAGAVYDSDIDPDWTLVAGDYLEIEVAADGGHQDISVHVQGTQTLGT